MGVVFCLRKQERVPFLRANYIYYTMSHPHLEKIKEITESLSEDFARFYDKDNKAAGTRIRKAMQELKTIAQQVRTEIQDRKNKAQA